MWVEIISIAGVLVLLGLALALLCAYNIITELLYRLICKMTAHVVEPLKILPRWIITKIPPLAKLRDAAEDSLWSSAAVFIIVMVLFLASLAYLLFSAFSSGDFWTYIGDEFLFSLPSISFMALTLGTSADTEMAFLEIMTESTMIGLCLYHVNKYISDLEVAPKVFYNIVFTFIGWAISHLVSYYIFVPLVALFPIGQFIMEGELLSGLAEIPVLWHILNTLSWIFGLALIILAVWLFLAVLLVALREFVAPIPFSLLLLLGTSLILNLFPELDSDAFALIIFAGGCICYEIYRVIKLSEIEEEEQETAENNVESLMFKCSVFFTSISDTIKKWIKHIFSKKK